ncbi:MAG: agmatine deiminase family protein [Oligoflexia bacterium]|nr:agmatine deiminase family protein [Oligoflexia bacterium]
MLTLTQFASASGLKAQYEPIKLVLLSSGTNLMDYIHRVNEREILNNGTYLEEFKATEEVNNFYNEISQLSPIVIFASDSIPKRLSPYMKTPKSEYVLAKEVFPQATVISPPISIFSNPQYLHNESLPYPDRWIRDWGPYTINGQLVHNIDQVRGTFANPSFSTFLQSSLKSSIYFPVGGTFMKTSNGVCAISATSNMSKLKILGHDTLNTALLAGERLDFMQNTMGCSKIIPIEPLPVEPLGHLDIFVKFLSDKKVAIAKYKNDFIKIRTVRKYRSTECFPPNSGQCNSTYILNNFTGSLSNLEEDLVEFKDFKKYIFKKYPSSEIELLEPWNFVDDNQSLNLKKFSEDLSSMLQAQGFEVIEIEQPSPIVTIKIFQNKKLGKQLKIEKIQVGLHYPTYLNSFLVNGTVLVPIYNHWSTPELNNQALEKYRSTGFKVRAVAADFISLQGGTIHCVTKELHF